MARCGCGDGTPASIRALFSASDGVDYNPLTGHFTAAISSLPGNNLTLDGSGDLFVPTGAATVTTGPGILGDGSGGNPVRANVSPWPYPTAPVTGAQGVFVHPVSGLLVSPPPQQVDMVTTTFARNYANLAVNAGGAPVTADTFVTLLSNPDLNRSAAVLIWREVDMRFTLPGTASTGPSSAGVTVAADETARFFNNGSTTLASLGTQTSKTFESTTLGPGAGGSHILAVGTQSGTGGATYSRIEVAVHVLYISL